MGKSGAGDQEVTVRYAPYIEDAHSALIQWAQILRDNIVYDSPFDGLVDNMPAVDLAFFGTGYTIASFPTLYDMFGKFMAGLDLEVLHEQIFQDTVYGGPLDDLIGAEADYLDDEINSVSIPRLQAGMRDMNAVMSSSYIVGRSLIEEAKVKAINKFAAELRTQAMNIALNKWNRHLDWCNQVTIIYAELTKMYYTLKMDKISWKADLLAKDKLWSFTVLGEVRTIVGAMAGTAAAQQRGSPSTFARATSGLLSGAATGAMVGSVVPGIGTAVGAVVGGVLGLAGGLAG